MTIKQLGGVFGRNPTFNNVTIDGELIINGSVFTGLDYEGAWNADTNTPTLTSSVGTLGQFYIVSVAGATDLNGITNWDVGDWALFNGSVWQRVEGGANGNFSTLSVSGLSSLNGGANVTGNATFGDNSKAIFGASSDLQIYHDPAAGSIIQEGGSGSLFIRASTNIQIEGVNGENMAIFNENGSVQLYYDNAEKLATTVTGIDVTGSVTADGLTVDGDVQINKTAPNLLLMESDTTDLNSAIYTTSGNLRVYTVNDAINAFTTRFNINHATGDISFYNAAGTSQSLFWDASAESLGLGTTTPDTGVHLKHYNAGATSGTIRIQDQDTQQDADQQTGGIEFYTQDATDPTEGVSTAIKSFQASSNGGAYLTFSTTDIGTSTLDERMRIDSSGNVGIGTDTPIYTTASRTTTTINGASSANLSFGVGGTGYGNIYVASNTMSIGTQSAANPINFTIGGATKATLDASGNLLVGQSSTALPGAGNTTEGISVSGQYDAIFASRGAAPTLVLNRNSDGDIQQFRKDGQTVGSISVTASATAYNTSSDQRLKDNIVDADDAGSKIDAIQVRKFDWKVDGSHQDYGMVAQELLEVAPEAVSQGETEDDMMAVDYSKLVPMMLKEIQSLRARIAALES